MIHYTQIIWEEVAFSWKVTGKDVAISIAPTVHAVSCSMIKILIIGYG